METEPIWFKYATFDRDGYVNGVRDDAPLEVKKAFKEYQRKLNEYKRKGKPIPR